MGTCSDPGLLPRCSSTRGDDEVAGGREEANEGDNDVAQGPQRSGGRRGSRNRRNAARATGLSRLAEQVSDELKEEVAMLTSHPIIAGMEAGIRRERLEADARKLSKKTVRIGRR